MWVAIIIAIVFLSGFGISWYLQKKKQSSIVQPVKKPISRKEGSISGYPDGSWIYDPSISGYVELTGNIRIQFEFCADGNAFIPHQNSLNHFQCDQSILTYTKENTTIDFVLSTPNPVKIYNMSFGFLYNEPHDANKPVILCYTDPVSGTPCYLCKNLFGPIEILPNGGCLTTTEMDLEEPILLNDIMYFKLSISSDTENVSRIYMNKIMAFELLLDTQEKDEYGSPLWPVVTEIKGTFSPS